MSRWTAPSDYDYQEETGNPVPRMERSQPSKRTYPSDDIDSRDKPCRCQHPNDPACPKHGIAASNARQNRYWQRVGGHE